MADQTTNTEQQDTQQELTPQQQGIQFEDILPWGTTGGDTGLSSRLKLKRNFEKIKAWIDSLSFDIPDLTGRFLSKTDDDEAEGTIGFRAGLWAGARQWFFDAAGKLRASMAEVAGLLKAASAEVAGGMTVGGALQAGSASVEGDATVGGNLGVAGTIRGSQADIEGGITAGGDITALGQLTAAMAEIDRIRSSEYTGDGLSDIGFLIEYAQGKAKAVFDNLVVRGKFTVNELEVRKWTYAGGNMVFSAAGSVIHYVDYIQEDAQGNENILGYTQVPVMWVAKGTSLWLNGLAWAKRKLIRSESTVDLSKVTKFRCYILSDDGSMQTRNWWKPGDQAKCETLNRVRNKTASEGSFSGTASNTVYWRLVTAIGSKTVEGIGDGKFYDYIDLSVDDCDRGSDIPAAGDSIVQMGHRTERERMGFVTIEVTGDTRGVKVYSDVNSYSLVGKRKTVVGPDVTEIIARRFYIETEYGNQLVPANRGLWTAIAQERCWDGEKFVTGRKCYYYDVVSHNGTLWLCQMADGYHWEDGDGRHYTDAQRQAMSADDRRALTQRRNYTLAEPMKGGVWTEYQAAGVAPYLAVEGKLQPVPCEKNGTATADYTATLTVRLMLTNLECQLKSLTIQGNDSHVRKGTTLGQIVVSYKRGDTVSAQDIVISAAGTLKNQDYTAADTMSVYPVLKGDDAYTIEATPQTLVLTQQGADKTYQELLADLAAGHTGEGYGYDITTGGRTGAGSAAITVTKDGVGQTFYIASLATSHSGVTASYDSGSSPAAKRVWLTHVPNNLSSGWVDATIAYGNNFQQTLRIQFYCNLMGTWRQMIVGDANLVVTAKTEFKNKDGNTINVSQFYAEYIQSSKEMSERFVKLTGDLRTDLDNLEDTVGNNYDTLSTNLATYKRTADGQFADMSSRIETVNTNLTKKINDDVAGAKSYADSKVGSAKSELEEALDAAKDAQKTIDKALEDGYIDNDEREALKAVRKQLVTEYADVTATYSTVYADVTDSSTPANAKKNLKTAKDNLDAAYSAVIEAIDALISSTGKLAKGTSGNISQKFSTFNTRVTEYRQALENANKAMRNAIDARVSAEIANRQTAINTAIQALKDGDLATAIANFKALGTLLNLTVSSSGKYTQTAEQQSAEFNKIINSLIATDVSDSKGAIYKALGLRDTEIAAAKSAASAAQGTANTAKNNAASNLVLIKSSQELIGKLVSSVNGLFGGYSDTSQDDLLDANLSLITAIEAYNSDIAAVQNIAKNLSSDLSNTNTIGRQLNQYYNKYNVSAGTRTTYPEWLESITRLIDAIAAQRDAKVSNEATLLARLMQQFSNSFSVTAHGLTAEIAARTTSETSLQSQITTNKTSIEATAQGLRTDVNQLSTRVGNQQSSIDGMQSDIDDISSGMSTMEQRWDKIAMNVYNGVIIYQDTRDSVYKAHSTTPTNIYSSSYSKIDDAVKSLDYAYLYASCEVKRNAFASSGDTGVNVIVTYNGGSFTLAMQMQTTASQGGAWCKLEARGMAPGPIRSIGSVLQFNTTGYGAYVRNVTVAIVTSAEAKLVNTGIDISNGKIRLMAENTEVDGNLKVGSLDTQEQGGYRIRVEGGHFDVYNALGQIGLSVGWDANGDPYLILANGDGSKKYKLTYNGVEQESGNFTSDSFAAHVRKLLRNGFTVSDVNSQPDVTHYAYTAARHLTTGEYQNSDGKGTARATYNGKVFTTNDITKVLAAGSSYYPADGYYLLKSGPVTVDGIKAQTVYNVRNGSSLKVGTVYSNGSYFTDSNGNNGESTLRIERYVMVLER